MGHNGAIKCRNAIIGDIKLFAFFFNYFTHCRIMNMADTWEKMVFYLVIQSTCKPGDHFIFWRKVGGSL